MTNRIWNWINENDTPTISEEADRSGECIDSLGIEAGYCEYSGNHSQSALYVEVPSEGTYEVRRIGAK